MVQRLDEILDIFIIYGINFNIISRYISKDIDSHVKEIKYILGYYDKKFNSNHCSLRRWNFNFHKIFSTIHKIFLNIKKFSEITENGMNFTYNIIFNPGWRLYCLDSMRIIRIFF